MPGVADGAVFAGTAPDVVATASVPGLVPDVATGVTPKQINLFTSLA